MSNRPNPIWHMIMWGINSGFVLSLLYYIVFIIVASIFYWESFGVFFSVLLTIPAMAMVALFLVSIPGALMGAIVGLCLWQLIRNVPLPFMKSDMKRIRIPVYGIVFIVTLFLSAILIYILLSAINSIVQNSEFWTIPFLTIFPPIIAAFASTYAAHRYLINLHEWSKQVDVRKSKAKNDDFQHLTDENAASDYQLNVDDSAHYQERRQ